MGRTIKKAADKTDEEDGSFVMLIRGSMGYVRDACENRS
jgi:hypothetical protein